ncbi:MAG: type II CRISPR-associated endonuclease Cas1, partial [Clostridia bacterium]
MAFRTVVVKNRCKLDFSLNYMVCRGEVETKIHLSEIAFLIVETTAVSITAALLVELIKNKIKVIFCDEKHMPNFQLIGFDDNYHSVKQIKQQIGWSNKIKEEVWTDIVKNKIENQSKILKKFHCIEENMLKKYVEELSNGDETNREGHAAKVYFNALFGNIGRRVPNFYNSALNYGYSILLSAFCREITASGCITQLGIWHCNEFNPCNFASDLMETFRIIVDDLALSLPEDATDFKHI